MLAQPTRKTILNKIRVCILLLAFLFFFRLIQKLGKARICDGGNESWPRGDRCWSRSKTFGKPDHSLKSRARRALCFKPSAQLARGPSGFPCSASPWHLPLGCATAPATLGFPRSSSLGFTSNPRSDPFFALPPGVVTWRQHYFFALSSHKAHRDGE